MKSLLAVSTLAAALLAGGPSLAQLARNSDAPVDVTADELEVNNTQCTSTWRGNAEALQGDSRLRANVLKTFMQPKSARPAGSAGSGNCGDMTRMEAQGAVYYVTPTQRVKGDSAVYDAAADTIVVTGDVVAVQEQNVLRGSRMVFNLKTGEGHMTGSGKGLNQPGRPRGVFYPNKTTQSAAK